MNTRIKFLLVEDASLVDESMLSGVVIHLPETGINMRLQAEKADKILRLSREGLVTVVTTSEVMELRLRRRIAETWYGTQPDDELRLMVEEFEYWYLSLAGDLERITLSQDGARYLDFPAGFNGCFTVDSQEAASMTRLTLRHRVKHSK